MDVEVGSASGGGSPPPVDTTPLRSGRKKKRSPRVPPNTSAKYTVICLLIVTVALVAVAVVCGVLSRHYHITYTSPNSCTAAVTTIVTDAIITNVNVTCDSYTSTLTYISDIPFVHADKLYFDPRDNNWIVGTYVAVILAVAVWIAYIGVLLRCTCPLICIV